jgi:high-affinity iron transporter
MLASALVMVREGLEAALIVGIILAYLAKTGNRTKFGLVWLGTGLAVLMSVIVGAGIFLTAGGLAGRAETFFEGTAMITAAGVLTYMIFWMRKQAINIRAHLHAKVSMALQTQSLGALAVVAFVAVGREGVESALFLFALTKAATPVTASVGGFLGLGVAVVLGYLLYRGTYRLNLRTFFNVTSILLLLFAAGLLAQGTHEFHEAGLIPTGIEHVWDTNAIVHESSTFGSLLKAVFGYTGNPSLAQVLVYASYLLVVGWAYFRPPTAKELAPQRTKA